MQGHEPKDMDTELDLLSDRARASGAERVENVAHLLSPANLKESLGRLKRRRVTGTDGVTLEEYGLKCLFVNVTEETYVGNLQVRFCEGR